MARRRPHGAGRGVRVAVMGCGYWGRNLARNFAAIGALAAVYDHTAANAEAFVRDFGVPALDYGGVLGDRAIDAVAVATPARAHFAMAREALLAGKHVFVEKPLAARLGDAEELRALAHRQGRVLMAGHLLRYHPAFERLAALAADGALGRLRHVAASRLMPTNPRGEHDILWCLAPHDVSMILALFAAEPERVAAVGGRHRDPAVLDLAAVHLGFADGRSAQVFASWVHPVREQRLVVVGEHATAVFDDGRGWPGKLTVYDDGAPSSTARPVALEPAEPLARECRHFVACVADGAAPLTGGDEAVRVLRTVAAAEEALESGAAVTLGRRAAARDAS